MVGIVMLIIALLLIVFAFSIGSVMLLMAFYGTGGLTIVFGFSAIIFAFTTKRLQKTEKEIKRQLHAVSSALQLP